MSPHTIALRAVFVPEGETPPPEFLAAMHEMRLPASRDPETGEITTENIGNGVLESIPGRFYRDVDQDLDDSDGSTADSRTK